MGPKRIKGLSTPDFALSIAQANPVADGPRVDSNSRASPVWHGRSLAGWHLKRRPPNPAPRILLLHQPRVAVRRTKRTATRATVLAIAILPTTWRCKVRPVTTPRRRYLLLSPLLHKNLLYDTTYFPFSFGSDTRECFIARDIAGVLGWQTTHPWPVSETEMLSYRA